MPSEHQSRAAALVLLLTVAGVQAHAFSRSGSLSWSFNDITTKNPSGSAHYSSWGQAYGLNLAGDLVHPVVGTFNTGGAYSEGANINSTVNSDVTGQRDISYNTSLDLFHPDVQRYVRFAPSYSVQSTKYMGSQAHTITNDHWGYSTGLSLPHMPAVSASRQYNRLKDASGVVPTDQRQTLMSEHLSYQLGGMRFNLNQDRQRTEDARNALPAPLSTTQKASLDYGRSDIKPLKLQYLTLRTEYLRYASDDVTTGKSLANFVSLRTNEFRPGAWKHALNYTNDSRRDLLRKTHEMSHTMLISSSRPVPRGNFINSTVASASGKGLTTRSGSLGPYISLAFRDGRVLTAINGNLGWSRNSAESSFLSDALGTRLDLKPRRALDFFVDLQTSESLPLTEGVQGGRRNSRVGLGSTRRYGGGDTTIRYDRSRERSYATGGGSDSDHINLNASATPAQRLRTTAGGSFGETRTTDGGKSNSKNLTGSMTYSTLWGLSLTSDASFAAMEQYTANAGATYSMGKTSFNIKYTYTATPLPSSYSFVSLTLSRML